MIMPTIGLQAGYQKSLEIERLLLTFFYEKIRHHIIPSQFGFQSQKRAALQLLDFIETIKDGKFEQQYILYLDYAKAFDKVTLTVLLSKLSSFGFDDGFLELLTSYVNENVNVSACKILRLLVKHQCKKWCPSTIGIWVRCSF